MILLAKKTIGLLFFLGTLVLSLIAIVAALGFIHPSLDVFNHLQPIIFVATFICLLVSPLFLRTDKWQALAITIAATGFLSSAIIFVPEIVLGLQDKSNPIEENQQAYKLLTHNIFGKNYDMQRLANSINYQNPDIITLQEYFPYQRERLHPLLIKNYPYFSICTGGKRANIAIYAKMAFERLPASVCADDQEQRTSQIFAKFMREDEKEFVVLTTHLDWPMQVSKLDDGENLLEGICLAFARKQEQYKKLAKAIKDISEPLILAADFNSTSWSYALRNFAVNNKLKLLTRGFLTYPNRFYIFGWRSTIPIIPLDHIMVTDNIIIHDVTKGEPAGSDHNSVIISFSI